MAFGVRRCRCAACQVSHALLPAFLVAGRMDLASAIGRRFGWARRRDTAIAALGVPEHGARMRAASRAGALRSLFAALVSFFLGAQRGARRRGGGPRVVLEARDGASGGAGAVGSGCRGVRVVVFVRSERRVVAGQHGRALTRAVGGREGAL